MLKEFKEFALRGNVMDMAIGVIIGTAFGKIISSLVSDILMPPIGALLGECRFHEYLLESIRGEVQEPGGCPGGRRSHHQYRSVHQHVDRFHHHRSRPLPGLETDQ